MRVNEQVPTVELTEEQAIDKLQETGWLIRHDKEMTERPQDRDNFDLGYIQGLEDGRNEARPQGEWIDHSEDYGYAECPFCHELTNCDGPIEELNFCWKCGAKLGKAVQNE